MSARSRSWCDEEHVERHHDHRSSARNADEVVHGHAAAFLSAAPMPAADQHHAQIQHQGHDAQEIGELDRLITPREKSRN